MNNNYVSESFGRAFSVFSVGAIMAWGSVSDADATPVVQLPECIDRQMIGDTSRFNLFENSQPTSQTQVIKKHIQPAQEDLFAEDYQWVTEGITAFMEGLQLGDLPDYPDDLVELAEKILKNNPSAFI